MPQMSIEIITDPNEPIPAPRADLAVIWLTWDGTWEFRIGDGVMAGGERLSLTAALDWVTMTVRNRIGA